MLAAPGAPTKMKESIGLSPSKGEGEKGTAEMNHKGRKQKGERGRAIAALLEFVELQVVALTSVALKFSTRVQIAGCPFLAV